MNIKRFIAAAIVVFIANQITDPIIHWFILGETYQELQQLWRPDMMSKMWVMVFASFIFSFLFVYIFSKGYEGKGVLEGIRYGILIGFLMNGIAVMQQYVVYPVPFTLAIQWCVYGMIQFIIYGIIASLIYKPR